LSVARYCRFFSSSATPPKPPLWLRLAMVAFRQLSDSFDTCNSLLETTIQRKRWKKTHTLRKINMYTMIVDQDSLHLEVSLFAILLIFELDKSIL
jgi:hypothetical protein